MTGKQLAEFRTRMGWSRSECARQLGVGRNSIAGYEAADEVGLTIALAVAARANGLAPYGGTPAAPTGTPAIV
jgi:transcriptional regulator with XRE-family HTH domain